MTSPPLDSTHGRTTLAVACHHRLWATHTVEQYRCDMPSPPLDSTHGRMTSGRACHHRFWAAHTVERHRAWHSIIAFGKHTRSNDVGRGMTSPPLDNTHGQTKLAMTCHHRPCTARTVGRRQALHAITALEKHTRSNDVGLRMTSPPLERTHNRTTSGVA